MTVPRMFESYSSDGFQLGGSHDYELRIAGEGLIGEARFDATKTSEFARGAFAVSITPKAGCTPDGDGFGCDTVRLRGTFYERTPGVMP